MTYKIKIILISSFTVSVVEQFPLSSLPPFDNLSMAGRKVGTGRDLSLYRDQSLQIGHDIYHDPENSSLL